MMTPYGVIDWSGKELSDAWLLLTDTNAYTIRPIISSKGIYHNNIHRVYGSAMIE